MDTTELLVTLPTDLIEEIEEKLASGAYNNMSEVAQAGLLALFAEQEQAKRQDRNDPLDFTPSSRR